MDDRSVHVSWLLAESQTSFDDSVSLSKHQWGDDVGIHVPINLDSIVLSPFALNDMPVRQQPFACPNKRLKRFFCWQSITTITLSRVLFTTDDPWNQSPESDHFNVVIQHVALQQSCISCVDGWEARALQWWRGAVCLYMCVCVCARASSAEEKAPKIKGRKTFLSVNNLSGGDCWVLFLWLFRKVERERERERERELTVSVELPLSYPVLCYIELALRHNSWYTSWHGISLLA